MGAAGSKGVIGLDTPSSVLTTPLMEAGGGAYAEPETYQVYYFLCVMMVGIYLFILAC